MSEILSNDYFNFLENYEFVRQEGEYIHVYAAKFDPIEIKNNKAQFVFPFAIDKKGNFIAIEKQPENGKEILAKLWERIKGN